MRPAANIAEEHGTKLLGAAVFALVLFLIVKSPSPNNLGVPVTWLRAVSSGAVASTEGEPPGAQGPKPAPAPQGPAGSCEPMEHIIDKVFKDPNTAPQLQPDHVRWITTELDPLREGRPPHFLVFGLGMDSIMWRNVNCLGRTVFLEGTQAWIDKVREMDPRLEIYHVTYNTTVGTSPTFYAAGPWSLDVPDSVKDDCYDVILVDAPQGFNDEMPGRFQSAQLAIDIASECVDSGRKGRVPVFLHDAQRPGEQAIIKMQIMKNPRAFFMGAMPRRHGHLYGFEFSSNWRTKLPVPPP